MTYLASLKKLEKEMSELGEDTRRVKALINMHTSNRKIMIKAMLSVSIAFLAHILPAVGLVWIACGNETMQAVGAGILLVSAFACGYFHGLNRTKLF